MYKPFEHLNEMLTKTDSPNKVTACCGAGTHGERISNDETDFVTVCNECGQIEPEMTEEDESED